MTRAFVSLSLCLTLVAAPARADQCDVRLTEGAARVESETQTFAPETGQGPRVTLVGDAAARPRSWQVRGRDQWYRFRHAIDFGLAGLAGTLAIVGPEQARPAVIGLVLILIYRGLTRWVRRAPATARGPFDEPSATPPETMLDTLIRVGREDAVTPVMVIVPRSEFIASAHALSVGGYAPIDHAVTETKLLTHRPGLSLGQSSNLATRRLLGKAASTSTAEVNERPAAEPIEAVASPLTDADTSPISSDRSSNGTDSPTHDFTAAAAVDGRESPAAVAIADGVVANRELITWRRRLDLGQKHERGLNSTSAAEVKSAGTIQPPLPPRQATRRSPLDLARPTLVLDQNQTRSNAGLRDAVAGPALVARSIDGEKKSERKLIPWRRPLNFGRKIDPDLDSTSAAEVDLAESENVEQRPRLLTRRLRLEFGRPALMFDQSRHSSGLAENIPQETEVGGIKVERKLITWRGPLTLGLKRNQEPGFTSAAEVKVSAEALAHRPPRLLNRRLPLNFGRPVIIDHLRHASAEAPYPTVATAVPAEMAAITKRKLLTWHRPLDFGLPPRSELASTSAAEVNSARTPADVQPKRLLTSRSRLDLGRPVRHPWNTAPAGSDATSSPTPTSPEPSPTVGPSQISTAFPKHSGRARGRLIEPLTSAAEVDSRKRHRDALDAGTAASRDRAEQNT